MYVPARWLMAFALLPGCASMVMAQRPIVLDDTARFYQEEEVFSIRMDEGRVFNAKDLTTPEFQTGFRGQKTKNALS